MMRRTRKETGVLVMVRRPRARGVGMPRGHRHRRRRLVLLPRGLEPGQVEAHSPHRPSRRAITTLRPCPARLQRHFRSPNQTGSVASHESQITDREREAGDERRKRTSHSPEMRELITSRPPAVPEAIGVLGTEVEYY